MEECLHFRPDLILFRSFVVWAKEIKGKPGGEKQKK
jgi:hypothetical protein